MGNISFVYHDVFLNVLFLCGEVSLFISRSVISVQ